MLLTFRRALLVNHQQSAATFFSHTFDRMRAQCLLGIFDSLWWPKLAVFVASGEVALFLEGTFSLSSKFTVSVGALETRWLRRERRFTRFSDFETELGGVI
jgi:hypothetical protein